MGVVKSRSFALPLQELPESLDLLCLALAHPRLARPLPHLPQPLALLLEGPELLALHYCPQLLLVLVSAGEHRVPELVGHVGVQLHRLLGGHLQQRAALQPEEARRQQFPHLGHGLQEVVHVGVLHDAVLEGLLGLHPRRRIRIINRRPRKGQIRPRQEEQPSIKLTKSLSQRQQSGREVSQPQIDSLFKDFAFFSSRSPKNAARLSCLGGPCLPLKLISVLLMWSASLGASPTFLILIVSNIELRLSTVLSFRSRHSVSRGALFRRCLRRLPLLPGLSTVSRSSYSSFTLLSERKERMRLLTTTGKTVQSWLCSGESLPCLLRAKRMENCVLRRLKKLCSFVCASRLCGQQCRASGASMGWLRLYWAIIRVSKSCNKLASHRPAQKEGGGREGQNQGRDDPLSRKIADCLQLTYRFNCE